MAIIAPSLLASNFLKLGDECAMLDKSEAEWFHLDVMDGRFVPNISFGPMVVEFIRKTTKKFCDVHLMIEEPANFSEQFKKAGADQLTVHIEACPHLNRNLQQIKGMGMKAGIAINPHTPISSLADSLYLADTILVMSVNPGFGGQQFIPQTVERISQLRILIDERNAPTLIEVDGGIGMDNVGMVVQAGADVIVAGSSVFGAESPATVISDMKKFRRPS
ncbi:MAG: ribulose-phosphate 3-epimerase [Chitinophagaceae bacterium]|nr:MAG: ribulose-phosphate 3-epimerase [Chitinophagaceae bacterium]